MDKKANKKVVSLIFIIYCLILLKLILFKYPRALIKELLVCWNLEMLDRNIKDANFIPFSSIRRDILTLNSYYIKVLIYNIMAFIPMGFLLPLISKRARNMYFTIIVATAFSFLIEISQLITVLGTFDIDDILLNTLGTLIGYVLYLAFIRIRHVVYK